MSRYYCPYCNPDYQIIFKNNSEKKICNFCGEDLVKKPFISIRQILALIIATSFLLPLIYLFAYYIKYDNNQKKEIFQANLNFSLFYK